MQAVSTHMRAEIDEIAQAVERMLDISRADIDQAAAMLRSLDPPFAISIARGSSDHAALFFKYAVELTLAIPLASIGPSLASIYGITPRMAGAAAFAISQSGASPDIVAMAQRARAGGAATVALTNTLPSPLADACDHSIDIAAGPELSVAATKSFVCAIAAGLAIIARWARDDALAGAVEALPTCLEQALANRWATLENGLEGPKSVYVLGRGPIVAIAHEAALKFKETCGIHAEAYSAAEVLHGPVEIVGPRFPVIVLAAADAAESSTAQVADRLAEQGATVFATSPLCSRAHVLERVVTGHPLTDALVSIMPLYDLIERWSRRRGRDPDQPRNLQKVTQTT